MRIRIWSWMFNLPLFWWRLVTMCFKKSSWLQEEGHWGNKSDRHFLKNRVWKCCHFDFSGAAQIPHLMQYVQMSSAVEASQRLWGWGVGAAYWYAYLLLHLNMNIAHSETCNCIWLPRISGIYLTYLTPASVCILNSVLNVLHFLVGILIW